VTLAACVSFAALAHKAKVAACASVRAASKACDSLVATNKGDDGLYTSSGQSERDDLQEWLACFTAQRPL
jgi:hypothetical protein